MNTLHAWLKRLKFTWAYLHDPPWDTEEAPPELKSYVEQHTPGAAIDLGCGTGTNVLFLAQHGWLVDGIDFSGLAIRRACRRVRQARVAARLVQGDVTRLSAYSLRPPYALALDVGCLHALGSWEAAQAYAAGLKPRLKPGADYLLYAHQPYGPDETYPAHGLTLAWVLRLFGDALEVTEYRPGAEGSRPSAWYFLHRTA